MSDAYTQAVCVVCDERGRARLVCDSPETVAAYAGRLGYRLVSGVWRRCGGGRRRAAGRRPSGSCAGRWCAMGEAHGNPCNSDYTVLGGASEKPQVDAACGGEPCNIPAPEGDTRPTPEERRRAADELRETARERASQEARCGRRSRSTGNLGTRVYWAMPERLRETHPGCQRLPNTELLPVVADLIDPHGQRACHHGDDGMGDWWTCPACGEQVGRLARCEPMRGTRSTKGGTLPSRSRWVVCCSGWRCGVCFCSCRTSACRCCREAVSGVAVAN